MGTNCEYVFLRLLYRKNAESSRITRRLGMSSGGKWTKQQRVRVSLIYKFVRKRKQDSRILDWIIYYHFTCPQTESLKLSSQDIHSRYALRTTKT